MLEDEFEESSDAMDEEIEDGIAENAGQDGDSQQALEEEDAGANQASPGSHGASKVEGNWARTVDAADASDAESGSDEASSDGGSDAEAVGAVKIRPADASSESDVKARQSAQRTKTKVEKRAAEVKQELWPQRKSFLRQEMNLTVLKRLRSFARRAAAKKKTKPR